MAYAYRNKKTGEVIYLNRRVKTAFWEEELPEEDDAQDQADQEKEIQEDSETMEESEPAEEPAEEAPKKTSRSRGKK